jgi:hypothetical protein
MPTELLKGTLDLLILRTLTLSPNHGLGIARRIERMTNSAFDVKPGSLFPPLHRLEEQGWVSSRRTAGRTRRGPISVPDFLDWRGLAKTHSSVALFETTQLSVTQGEPGLFYLQDDHTGGMKCRNITVSVPK